MPTGWYHIHFFGTRIPSPILYCFAPLWCVQKGVCAWFDHILNTWYGDNVLLWYLHLVSDYLMHTHAQVLHTCFLARLGCWRPRSLTRRSERIREAKDCCPATDIMIIMGSHSVLGNVRGFWGDLPYMIYHHILINMFACLDGWKNPWSVERYLEWMAPICQGNL